METQMRRYKITTHGKLDLFNPPKVVEWDVLDTTTGKVVSARLPHSADARKVAETLEANQ